MSIEQGRDISELFRRVSNIIRIGKVISVDYTKAKAKVKIGNLTTEYLPWLTPSTAAWIPLKNGEQVLVLSPNGDLRMGMILPALYQNSKTPPAHDSNKITFNVDVAHKGAISVTGNITRQSQKDSWMPQVSFRIHLFGPHTWVLNGSGHREDR